MITVQKLDHEEVYDALNLVKEVFFASGNLGYPREGAKAFLEFLSERGELLNWYGAYDKALEGALAYSEDWHLALLFVREENQHKGIARKLVLAAQDWCKEKGLASLTVTCAPCDEDMYQALGFDTQLGYTFAHIS